MEEIDKKISELKTNKTITNLELKLEIKNLYREKALLSKQIRNKQFYESNKEKYQKRARDNYVKKV